MKSLFVVLSAPLASPDTPIALAMSGLRDLTFLAAGFCALALARSAEGGR